ncbi:MAG: hypothetical protein L0H63_14965 [Nitrococcus sp.]|nr:hypothetical protein [Nitrococcus sp.]
MSHKATEALAFPPVDHLLLLVGSNPLPDAVAARLLAHRTSTTISLIGSRSLDEVTERLRRWLEGDGFQQVEKAAPVDEADAGSIASAVWEELQRVDALQVGLNYTGGTKVMAVHAYRAVLEAWRQTGTPRGRAEPVFTYLDAHSLSMVSDPRDPKSGAPSARKCVALATSLQFEHDLLALHGWQFKCTPGTAALLPTSAAELADIYCRKNGANWRTWVDQKLTPSTRRAGSLCPWPSDPTLQGLANTLQEELDLTGSNGFALTGADALSAVASAGSGKPPTTLYEWLHSKWLESWALKALQDNRNSSDLHDLLMNVKAQLVKDPHTYFELDVVAMRGYRLFAFSCSTSTGKGDLKLKLFEAYLRARQIGGDEARVALVCCSDNPDKVRQEAERDLHVQGEPIRVFGRDHLKNLAYHIGKWIPYA